MHETARNPPWQGGPSSGKYEFAVPGLLCAGHAILTDAPTSRHSYHYTCFTHERLRVMQAKEVAQSGTKAQVSSSTSEL